MNLIRLEMTCHGLYSKKNALPISFKRQKKFFGSVIANAVKFWVKIHGALAHRAMKTFEISLTQTSDHSMLCRFCRFRSGLITSIDRQNCTFVVRWKDFFGHMRLI